MSRESLIIPSRERHLGGLDTECLLPMGRKCGIIDTSELLVSPLVAQAPRLADLIHRTSRFFIFRASQAATTVAALANIGGKSYTSTCSCYLSTGTFYHLDASTHRCEEITP